MCKCKNIEFGSYDRQTSMRTPQGEWVCICTCIVQEIAELWYEGVKTIESCCGHNKNEGYIYVSKDSDSKMKKLGYKSQVREQFFYPLTITIKKQRL